MTGYFDSYKFSIHDEVVVTSTMIIGEVIGRRLLVEEYFNGMGYGPMKTQTYTVKVGGTEGSYTEAQLKKVTVHE